MKKLALVLMLMILCVSISSCVSLGYVYSDSDEYTRGGASVSGRVEELKINWVDGVVKVNYHDGNEIIISETVEGSLSRDMELHWRLENKTLTVQYAASGLRKLKGENKQLTVLLPEGLKLDEVEISVASAEVEADGLQAEEIKIVSASGRVALRQRGHAEKIEIDTASGGVAIGVEDADNIKLTSASGVVIADVLVCGEVKANTASGDIALQFASMPKEIEGNSISGNVTLRLPHEAGFVADFDSISGKFLCDLPAQKKGEGRYKCGNGRCDIEVSTVSGNVKIEKNMNAGSPV